MSKYLKIMIVLLVAVAFAAPAIADQTYRAKGHDYRVAVTLIDQGQFKDDAFNMNYYTLACVDGVKVHTSLYGEGMASVIIPGPCGGKPKPKKKLESWETSVPDATPADNVCTNCHDAHGSKLDKDLDW